jgi:hypothetical protein
LRSLPLATIRMQKLNIITISLLILMSCNDSSIYQLQNSDLLNKSFLLVNLNSDTIQIEFTDNCVKTYNWNFRTYEPWEVQTKNDSSILFFDGKYFELAKKTEDGFEFKNLRNDSDYFVLHEVSERRIKIEEINGKWIENKYLHWLSAENLPPPPCHMEGLDTFYIPSFEFQLDTCVSTKFCNKKSEPFRINEHFGIIEFGGFCTTRNQWRIKQISSDTMVVDVRYVEESTVKYIENEKLIKLLPTTPKLH